jgi:MtN3 and saliva related transmembrane protein
MDLTTVLGLVAGSLTTLAYFPQVLKTWRSRSADGMSWSMLVILCLGIGLWLIYGLYAHDTPVILANLLTLLFSSAILAMKIRYEAVPKLQEKRRVSVYGTTLSLESSFPQQWDLEAEVAFNPSDHESTSTAA